jgi:hypothetical protein
MPLFLDSNNQAWPMERLNLDDRRINEGTLQKLLHENPSLLPVDEIDGSFGPLVSLGREILGIDNLFLSPFGRLTVVETKLWRNPQATREVVAQILDYSSRLSTLDPEGLETACRNARVSVLEEGQSLYELAVEGPSQNTLAITEAEFHDALAKTLRHSRFLLLIVGDGIRESLDNILSQVHQSPEKRFTFGMVELQLYTSSHAEGLMVIPKVITRTREIIRAVVKVEHPRDVQVTVTLPPLVDPVGPVVDDLVEQAVNETAKSNLARLVKLGRELGEVTIVGDGNKTISCRVPVKDSSETIRIFRAGIHGGMAFTNITGQLRRLGKDPAPGEAHARKFQEVFPRLKPKAAITRHGNPAGTLPRFVNAKDVTPVLSDVESMFRSLAEALKEVGPGEPAENLPEESEDV